MLSTDVYRARLQETIAGLRYWAPALRHAASLDEDDAMPRYWRLAARPMQRSACPFDLILHDNSRYDLMVGPETYEDLPVDDLSLFNPLLEAIGNGAVITREWRTLNTGQIRRVETIVLIRGRDAWQQARDEPVLAQVPLDSCQRSDRHYTPYARAATPARG